MKSLMTLNTIWYTVRTCTHPPSVLLGRAAGNSHIFQKTLHLIRRHNEPFWRHLSSCGIMHIQHQSIWMTNEIQAAFFVFFLEYPKCVFCPMPSQREDLTGWVLDFDALFHWYKIYRCLRIHAQQYPGCFLCMLSQFRKSWIFQMKHAQHTH